MDDCNYAVARWHLFNVLKVGRVSLLKAAHGSPHVETGIRVCIRLYVYTKIIMQTFIKLNKSAHEYGGNDEIPC